MNTDLSVAPEIALLALPPAPAGPGVRVRQTDGRAAADLAGLAAAPQRWWDLVRFGQDGPLRIPVPGTASTWLLVLPPGSAAGCGCRLVTVLAGEATETVRDGHAPHPLRPGRVRVHGDPGPHRHRGAGPGYSVTLHAGAPSPVPDEPGSFLS